MILPTKHISTQKSLLGAAACALEHLDRPQTVSHLWEQVRQLPAIVTFERFILALDLLYAIKAVELEDGLLRRVST